MTARLNKACHKTQEVWLYFIAVLEDLKAKRVSGGLVSYFDNKY